MTPRAHLEKLRSACEDTEVDELVALPPEVLLGLLNDIETLQDKVKIIAEENTMLDESVESAIYALRHYIPDYPKGN